eukprot:CAMPEP_0198346340 /NCGR_PEP_ID=MMETSP1450-20131203/78988_1 /TAXON_ID=753684 ORGANISM="Madagascaria erythrocladiodes, Strain CCMP3234" /NCGR_SAMPLE_ID=MMETSP1450 /ASSEMBLY_ACC=CAM_ASM_001115 /LENGTH=62 /DNA_ID=CAMNT_0044051757 /DNA_START=1 /DNA_END=185 /DNA_ORIENTATION=-
MDDPASIYVANLHPRLCSELLLAVFRLAGPATSAKALADRTSGTPLGFGFVEYPSRKHAARA